MVFGVCVLNLKNRKNVRWLALIQFYSTTTACNGYIVNETLVDCCALVWNRKKYWKNETTNKTVFFFVNFIYFCSCWFDVIVLKIRSVTRMGYRWSSVWIWISHVSLSVYFFSFLFLFLISEYVNSQFIMKPIPFRSYDSHSYSHTLSL